MKPESPKKDAQKSVYLAIDPESGFDCVEANDGKSLLFLDNPREFTQAEADELLKIVRNGKQVCKIVSKDSI